MNALVLSGGGGKGAYQIGVWKALRKLRYPIDIVTGTSVGALNALLITQKSYFLASYIWKNVDFTSVFQDDIKKEQSISDMIKMYGENIIKNKGMSTDNLEKKIDKAIHYRRFYRSNINFGLVTFNISSLKPKLLTKQQIPKEKLKDYLIASATCFPAFKLKSIDGDKYIDGGYYDILPINLAIDMGAVNVIAVDLKSIGIRRKVKKENNITYICPKNNIGYCLLFDKKVNQRNIKYGYNDTMKIFGKLEGDKYTFKKGQLLKAYDRYVSSWKKNIHDFSQAKSKNLLTASAFDNIIEKPNLTKEFNKTLENLGKYLHIADHNIYSIHHYHTCLKKALYDTNGKQLDNNSKNSAKKLPNLKNKKEIIQYVYFNLKNGHLTKIRKIAFMIPNEFICACHLYTVFLGERHDI